MKKSNFLIICLIVFSATTKSFAQSSFGKSPHEAGFGVGMIHGFMDVGLSPDKPGDISGVEWASTMPGYSLFYRAKANSGLFNFNARWTSGWVSGNDANTTKEDLLMRNESYRTTLYQVSASGELNLLRDKEVSKGVKRFMIPYLHVGIGGMYFNPRIHGANYGLADKMYNTYQAQVERQSADDVLYKRWTMTVPFGFGLKFNVSNSISIQYQLDMTYALTDYLDNVSTVYGNPQAMVDDGTIASSIRSNRLDGVPAPSGAQKGNPSVNDMFMYNSVSFVYRFDMYEVYRSYFYQNLAFWLNKPNKRS